MEAVFLAGGFGTRLSKVLPNVPKCLAPLKSGGTFLDLMAARLKKAGAKRFVFLTHHLSEMIQNHVSDRYFGIPSVVVRENTPLGTGGSLVGALQYIRGNPFLVLNADTLLECDLNGFMKTPPPKDGIRLAAVRVPCGTRFGRIEIQPDGAVTAFFEKTNHGSEPGFINAGLYWVDRGFSSGFVPGNAYSLEKDIFPEMVLRRKLEAWKTDSQFLDVGTPEDLAFAQANLSPSRIP